ncbi:ATP-binding protein [Streptomyces sp. VRA16 Mangrove soil]|uniref:ATP-binding protein n=1 Tax=Streptomyces sp. VRA16 Mangrove soil TaxID=2817434 RepID=UPI001A9D63E8|nr:ATP-binding protein [Streptomyces sp. VRA16 Mangrove soil]MBO1337694.1 ATP-binding protein [Streptomyces sp. VRA16 Mangrove soil]
MIYAGDCARREPWVRRFSALPSEVALLRRELKICLTQWGLGPQVEAAQTCVSELVTNVIQHVGEGTPATLWVTLNGPYLRCAVEDPDTRALPTLLAVGDAMESGRGMALVDTVANHRWGVILRAGAKVVWCELAVDPLSYGSSVIRSRTPLAMAASQEVTVGVLVDLMHWLRERGYDPDEVLDRAQAHFEAEIAERQGRSALRPQSFR